jgi:ABC-type transport system substrate-binding protein
MGTYYISLNDAKEPFTNAKVRQALSLAIDRDYVANTLMQGVYTPAYNFIGTGITDWDGSAFMDNANGGKPYISKDYKANLAQAKQLLSDAGYPDGKGCPPSPTPPTTPATTRSSPSICSRHGLSWASTWTSASSSGLPSPRSAAPAITRSPATAGCSTTTIRPTC